MNPEVVAGPISLKLKAIHEISLVSFLGKQLPQAGTQAEGESLFALVQSGIFCTDKIRHRKTLAYHHWLQGVETNFFMVVSNSSVSLWFLKEAYNWNSSPEAQVLDSEKEKKIFWDWEKCIVTCTYVLYIFKKISGYCLKFQKSWLYSNHSYSIKTSAKMHHSSLEISRFAIFWLFFGLKSFNSWWKQWGLSVEWRWIGVSICNFLFSLFLGQFFVYVLCISTILGVLLLLCLMCIFSYTLLAKCK